MNTPNKLTVLRILLVPVLIVFLLVDKIPNRFLFALFIFIIASLTDHFDGKLARKNGQITNFGKFLDPLADKMMVMAALICFVDLGLTGAVPVIVILMREFIVTSVRLVAMGKGKVIAANIWGKVKTVSQIIAILVILVSQSFIFITGPRSYNFLRIVFFVDNFMVWVSVIFTVISGAIYIKDNIDFIKDVK